MRIVINIFKAIFNVLSPLEIIAFICFFVTICIAVAFSVRYYTPNIETILFIWKHYLGPLVISVLLAFIMLLFNHKRINLAKTLISRLRLFIAFAIIVYLHFNLKLWSQLINPNSYDHIYYKIDKQLQWLISELRLIRNTLPAFNKWNAYHDLFVLMFVLSFMLHVILRREFEKVLTATSLVLSIGGVAYSFAPAFGPFIYEKGPSMIATDIQFYMLDFYSKFVNSGGAYYDGRYFVAAVAAMPSLHIANALVFTYFSAKYIPWLLILYVPITFFLIIEAVVSRWHYLIDIPFGFLISVMAIIIAQKMHSKTFRR